MLQGFLLWEASKQQKKTLKIVCFPPYRVFFVK
jgi:hypothetical protein